MKRFTTSLLLAASLAASASLAHAAQIEQSNTITFAGGTSALGAAFAPEATGKTFLQNYLFSNSGNFSLSAAVISTALGTQSALDISGLSVTGNGMSYTGQKSVVGDTQYYTINLANLATGNYILAITGTVTGSGGGSYGGNISVGAAAVPEASTIAMMLAGLAVVGAGAWRRRRAVGQAPASSAMLAA